MPDFEEATTAETNDGSTVSLGHEYGFGSGASSQSQDDAPTNLHPRLGTPEQLARRFRALTFDPRAAGRATLKAAAVGGLIGILIPIFGVIVAGYLAVYFYRREAGNVSGPRVGWRTGAAAGATAFAIDYLFEIVQIFWTHSQQEYIQQLVKLWQSMGVDSNNPGIQAGIRIMFTPAGILASLLFGMLLAALLAGVIGAISALAMARRAR